MDSEPLELFQWQSDAWRKLENPLVTELFVGGAAGPGKSMFLSWHELHGATTFRDSVGILVRYDWTDLRDSTMRTFFRLAGRLGYEEGRHFTYNGTDKIVYWKNGSQTLFRHLKDRPSDPDYSSLGSTEYSRGGVDEANELEERAVDILSSRIRYNLPPWGGKLLLSGNPGEYWTKYRYFFDKDNNPVVLPPHRAVHAATLDDNEDVEFVKTYGKRLELSISNEYDLARLRYGDWLAVPRTGKEFFHKFSTQKHIDRDRTVKYDPSIALHVSLDFNTSPYMTLLVAQIRRPEKGGTWGVNFLKEYCLSHPLNTTRDVCTALKTDLSTGEFAGHKAGLFVYGDYSGKSGNTMATETERHNYDIAFNMLSRWVNNHSDRVKVNPAHVRARDFMNDTFDDRTGIRVTVNPSMTNTIRDLSHLKQGADGGILKEYATDPKTKIRYEKWGHCAQALYYLVCSAFHDTFEEHGRRAA